VAISTCAKSTRRSSHAGENVAFTPVTRSAALSRVTRASRLGPRAREQRTPAGESANYSADRKAHQAQLTVVQGHAIAHWLPKRRSRPRRGVGQRRGPVSHASIALSGAGHLLSSITVLGWAALTVRWSRAGVELAACVARLEAAALAHLLVVELHACVQLRRAEGPLARLLRGAHRDLD